MTVCLLACSAAFSQVQFVRGDCNGDGDIDISDPIRLLLYNFAGAAEPSCLDACDANDDGSTAGSTTDSIYLLHFLFQSGPAVLAPYPFCGVDRTGDTLDCSAYELCPEFAPVTIIRTSPADGETGVAVTRETILEFSDPLAAESVTPAAISATFAGEDLAARLHHSQDGRTVTLFYRNILPASARVRITVNGDLLEDLGGSPVDADDDGESGGIASIEFSTLTLTSLPGTSVCGRVFASRLVQAPEGAQTVNEPLEGVTITVDGLEDQIFAVTDRFGNFRLDNAPAGEFFVHIDGRTARNGVPEGAYYPFVGKSWRSVPGAETTVGEIYLPLVVRDTLQEVSETEDTVIGFPDSVLQEFPELEGVSLTVPADSLFADDGRRGGRVGIAPVSPDRLPGPLPPGLDFALVITVQTDGATNFDEPVPVCFPNLPDPETGEVLAPGAKSALWSFNHDTGRFEIVGSMTVSEDAQLVCSDDGVGIRAPGWHGAAPGSGGGPCPLECCGDCGDDPEPPCDECDCPKPPAQPIPMEEFIAMALQPAGGMTDPVYLFSREFHLPVVDLKIRGRGFDFIWARKYRSGRGPDTAQGNRWDFSYNVSLEESGHGVYLRDGNTRRDLYRPQDDSGERFALTGFFRDLQLPALGGPRLIFADGGRWEFHDLDDSPVAGKIRKSVDRNGNEMAFHYDAAGRLVRITDTLGRDIEVAYNADGFIESVTDFAGRQVRYEYHDGTEAGGSFGDLKSVTTPAVAGTPNGNDFPQGKTTTYTYADHRLLTITDGRRNDPDDPTFGDGPYLENVYDGRALARQVWGGDVVDLVSQRTPPDGPDDDFLEAKTVVNDRQGNVKEFVFDRDNHLVLAREFTGRADPRAPTVTEVVFGKFVLDEEENPPRGKLRPEDPDFFLTRQRFSEDGLLEEIIHANGNLTRLEYESGPPRKRGNVTSIERLPGGHEPRGDQASIVETFEYGTDFGGCCGLNFVTRHVDGRGNETLHEYDERGNRTRTTHRIPTIVEDFEYNEFGQLTARIWPDNGSGHRRRDEYTYHDAGHQRGYLHRAILDSENLGLTYTFEYDLVGNLVSIVDPEGDETRFVVNELDQVVQVIAPETEEGSGVRYRLDLFYDANNNLKRIDVENIDEAGVRQPNTHLTKTFEYEILNRLVRLTEEVDPARNVVTEFEYDRNRNLTLVRSGEAVRGNQPANIVRLLWDERDLLFQEIRAEGDAGQSTTRFDYDRNRNLARVSQGLEETPRVTDLTHDGYDRPVELVGPMGNVTSYGYDANHNMTSLLEEGEILDSTPDDGANTRLYEEELTHDEMDRAVRSDIAFFDTVTGQPIDDGLSTTEVTYSDNSQVVRVVNDNGHPILFAYDTANRLRRITDALNNLRTFRYDGDSNLTEVLEQDRSDLGLPIQTFTTTYEYDGLDRITEVRDNVGNRTRFGHDSRSNVTLVLDPLANVTRHVFDGLDRLVSTTRILTANGTGTGSPVGSITTTTAWDDASRLVEQRDDNGNACTYTHDALNRVTLLGHADGTAHTYEYDVHDNLTALTDANGNVVTSTYDLLDRLSRSDIVPGPGVTADTTFELYRFDGLSRLVRAEDDDSIVTWNYDSLSSVLRETLRGRSTLATHDGVGNMLSCTYPGGRTITCTYDELERKKTIRDPGGLIASYSFIGPDRVERCDLGNGTRSEFVYDGISGIANPAGDFGVQQIIRTTHTRASTGEIIDDRVYRWDRLYNKLESTDIRPGGTGAATDFAHDSAYRLIGSSRTPGATVEYTLDGVGNRTNVTGGNEPGAYTMNATLPEPGDRQCNQYTRTAFDGRVHDRNGNLLAAGGRSFAYDYRDRLVGYDDGAAVRAAYAYDALGRRIERVVDSGSPVTTRYFYSGWQVVEERSDADTTLASYVHGRDIDEVLEMTRGGLDVFYHSDELLNVTALTLRQGQVQERYEYDDFGAPSIFDASGTPRAASTINNPYLFNGRRHDPETGWYYYRTRYLDPRAGRFTTRDTIGVWGDPSNLGNGLAYVGNNPWSRRDPMGLGEGDGDTGGYGRLPFGKGKQESRIGDPDAATADPHGKSGAGGGQGGGQGGSGGKPSDSPKPQAPRNTSGKPIRPAHSGRERFDPGIQGGTTVAKEPWYKRLWKNVRGGDKNRNRRFLPGPGTGPSDCDRRRLVLQPSPFGPGARLQELWDIGTALVEWSFSGSIPQLGDPRLRLPWERPSYFEARYAAGHISDYARRMSVWSRGWPRLRPWGRR